MVLPRAYLLVGAFALTACGPRTHTLAMNPENNSGQKGTATLSEVGKKTRVDLNVMASDDPRGQSAHVHLNHCGEIGIVKAPLTALKADPKDATRFISTTEVDVTFDELRKGPFAINAHDARDFSLYVSCGNTDGP